MMKTSSIAVIDDRLVRGVVGSRSAISKELLENIVDLIELSSPKAVRTTNRLFREGNKAKSWVTLDKATAIARAAK